LKVTLLQTDIRWAQPEENIRETSRLLAEAARSDLYVLPEMWSTGFATQPHGIAADEATNPALLWMKDTARQHDCAITGSLAVKLGDGTFRNRHYFVDGRNDSVAFYDKHHLFTYGHENEFYTPGEEHTIVEFAGVRLLLLTCYDLRFPCWSRYADALNYDAIVLVANWPESRQSAWHLLTRARALENQSYLVACNRVGDDHYCHYAGCSVVVDAYGKAVAQCHKNSVESLTVTLDFAEQQRRRTKFRVLDDRDIL
jgi:predicted amidohydrolase